MGRWLIVFFIALLFTACQANVGDGTPPDTLSSSEDSKDTSMPSITSTVGLPADLHTLQPLWEVEQTQTSNRAGSVMRLYTTGQIFTWSNSRRVESNGKIGRQTAPYAWRLDAQVKPEGVASVEELIRTQFVKISTDESIAVGADQGTVIRRSYLDGSKHSIILPASSTLDLPQVIRDIDYAIQSNIIPGGVPVTQE